MNHQLFYLKAFTLMPMTNSCRTTTTLCKSFGYMITIRHYPGGDKMGKVVKGAGVAFFKKPTALSPLPTKLNNLIDICPHTQKLLVYIGLLHMEKTLISSTKKFSNSLGVYENKLKNNIICGTFNLDIIDKQGICKAKFTSSVDNVAVAVTQMMFNPAIPGPPMFKLYMLERFGVTLNVNRGSLFNLMGDDIIESNNLHDIKALRYMTMENLGGKADLNFLTELRVSFKLTQYLVTLEKTINLKILELRILHNTLPNSQEQRDCVSQTGQLNGDLLLRYRYNNKEFYIYKDIKQKIIDKSDFQYNRVKIGYLPYDTISSTETEAFINGFIDTLKNHTNTSEDIKELVTILTKDKKNIGVRENLLDLCNQFVFQNQDGPCGRMSIMLYDKLTITSETQAIMDLIPDATAKDIINSSMFNKENAIRLQQKFIDYNQSNPGISLREKIREQAIKDILNNKIWNTSSTVSDLTITNNED